MSELVELLVKLISYKSITPNDAGSLDFIAEYLKQIGFKTEIINFIDNTSIDKRPTRNLYAKYGNGDNDICFIGHVDVVPPGDLKEWFCNPFEAKIENGYIYGRGASDMKGSIAAFLYALRILHSKNIGKAISLMLTADEEGNGKNGIIKLLPYLINRGEKFTGFLTGEPTSEKEVGDIIKIGRRGSINFEVRVTGVQGHVAYPEKAVNPITRLMYFTTVLKKQRLDEGTEYFEPSNLEFTSIDTGNEISNIIPASITAKFNIRYNNLYNSDSLIEFIKNSLDISIGRDSYVLKVEDGAKPFITNSMNLANLLKDSVKEVIGITSKFATNGGTSDARFAAIYNDNIAELGLQNETAHHVNERILLADLEKLSLIYREFLSKS